MGLADFLKKIDERREPGFLETPEHYILRNKFIWTTLTHQSQQDSLLVSPISKAIKVFLRLYW